MINDPLTKKLAMTVRGILEKENLSEALSDKFKVGQNVLAQDKEVTIVGPVSGDRNAVLVKDKKTGKTYEVDKSLVSPLSEVVASQKEMIEASNGKQDNVYIHKVGMSNGKRKYFGSFANFDEVIDEPGPGTYMTYILYVVGHKMILQNKTPEGIYWFKSEDGSTFTGDKLPASVVKSKISKAVTQKEPEDDKNEDVQEALDPKQPASVWIDDFIKSDDVRFKGKSKEERIQMALGAWYAARKSAGLPVNKSVNEAKKSAEGGYTAVEVSKYTVKADKESGAPEAQHTVFDIMLDGEKVGELDVDDTLGFIGGKLHGKDLPELSDYIVARPLEALDNFLSSNAGIEWMSDVEPSPSKEDEVDVETPKGGEEITDTEVQTEDAATDGSMATVNNVSLFSGGENETDPYDEEKDKEEKKKEEERLKKIKEYEKDIKMSENFGVSEDIVKEATAILRMGHTAAFKKIFKITFQDKAGKQRVEAVAADSINHALERLYRFRAITQDDKMVDYTSEKLLV